MYTLNFYKEENTWYADIPNHSKEENEMVMGSDMFLDIFSKNGKDCSISFAIEKPSDYIINLTRTNHDWDGAYYIAKGNCCNDMEIWICNVTHDIYGEHPENIYILNIE